MKHRTIVKKTLAYLYNWFVYHIPGTLTVIAVLTDYLTVRGRSFLWVCFRSQCTHGTQHQRSITVKRWGSKQLFPVHSVPQKPRQDGGIVVEGILSVSHKVKR